ncbi:helix-turn-helix transcriptional regulator [Streptomyces olivoreticuli]|uniref:helix-turn-helix domain-containing protein n=1 Tax=Streptomyces olivoreticuli TaxID=68246 RepID=UPI00265A18B5|nr:helix-turn-helix transcriptional regulator [Streptomyces olivoreticuli]WKK24242.1 helix-turn-helix transcriptional regulator [Streptomyces olivoreticuli]
MTFHAVTARHGADPVDLGVLIRSRRHSRRPRMTQAELGALVGYSESWVCRVEKGGLVPPWGTLMRIADVLDIPPDELISAAHPLERVGNRVSESPHAVVIPAATVTAGVGKGQEDTVRRRHFLTGAVGLGAVVVTGTPASADPAGALEAALFQPLAAAPVPLERLERALKAGREDFRRARYATLGDELPMLLAGAEATRDALTGHHREAAHALTACAYALACELTIKMRSDTSWVAADRALSAARASGQAVPLGEAARVLSVAMRHGGRHQAAVSLLTRTCTQLDNAADREAQAVRASLLLTCGYTAAHTGDRTQALDAIGEAEEISRRLAAGTAPNPGQFTIKATPAQCTAFRISVFNALGQPDEGVPHARHVNPAAFPTPERRARYFTDAARMWHQLGDHQRTYAALRAIEQQAPEEARRPSVRALTADLVYAPVNLPGLREYAARTGAIHS